MQNQSKTIIIVAENGRTVAYAAGDVVVAQWGRELTKQEQDAYLAIEAKIKAAKWLQREGRHIDIPIKGGKFGRRISLIGWNDTGEVECRDVEGDGRGLDFVKHAHRVLPVANLGMVALAIQSAIKETGAVDLANIKI